MKIGIDARMYGLSTRGIGRYAMELIQHLEQTDTQNEYVIFLHDDNFDEYVPKAPNFTKVKASFRWYTLKEQLYYGRFLKKFDLDLMHFLHFNVPFFYNLPFVVTIHDLILLRDTQVRATTLGPLKYAFKKFFYKKVIAHAVKSAQKVIALSKFGKQDVIDFFKTPADKIEVVYHGLSVLTNENTPLDNEALLRYNISDKPYFLYVGSLYPHKNIPYIIEALDVLANKYDFNLCLVGKKDFFADRLEQEYSRSYLKFLGFVPDAELNELYKNAHAFIFPSRYEGFGLPPLEALQNNCPVLAAKTSCLPEILEDSATYFDLDDVAKLAELIENVLKDPDFYKKYTQKNAHKTLSKYTWSTTAQQTRAIYEKANT